MRSITLPHFDPFQPRRQYVVPLFQRPCVWDHVEQWEPLWQEIAGRAEAIERDTRSSMSDQICSHFLGAIVLDQIKVYGRQVNTVEVIDGQQRLTTLQIMLAAFRDEVKVSEEKRLADALLRLTQSDGVPDARVERSNVWPTNGDRRDFGAALTCSSVQVLEGKYPALQVRSQARPAPALRTPAREGNSHPDLPKRRPSEIMSRKEAMDLGGEELSPILHRLVNSNDSAPKPRAARKKRR